MCYYLFYGFEFVVCFVFLTLCSVLFDTSSLCCFSAALKVCLPDMFYHCLVYQPFFAYLRLCVPLFGCLFDMLVSVPLSRHFYNVLPRFFFLFVLLLCILAWFLDFGLCLSDLLDYLNSFLVLSYACLETLQAFCYGVNKYH